VGATLTLDYTAANITADDGTGAAVALKPVDATGAALTGPLRDGQLHGHAACCPDQRLSRRGMF